MDIITKNESVSDSRLVLVCLSLTMLLSSLGTSSANVGLPTFAKVFNAAFQDVQWVVLAYLLVITSLIVSVGRLGDVIGRRRLMLVGLVIFTVASLMCAMAPTLWTLVASRVCQGLGAAIMMALTMAFVGDVMPKEGVGRAMGLLGTMSAIGTALGPSLGGLLIANLGWRSIFLINLPLGLLAFLLACRYLPVDRDMPDKSHSGFDIWGTLLLVLTLAAYALSMTLGQGNFTVTNAVLLLITFLGGGLLVWVESNAASPLISLAIFKNPLLCSGFVTSTLVATVIMTTLVVGPFYLSRALALDSAQIGLVMAVGPVVAALMGVPAGRSVDRLGAHIMTIMGLIGMAVGTGVLVVLPTSFGIAGYLVPLILVTASYALFQVSNNTSVMAGICSDQRGLISGMLNLSRNLGLITGASLMGAIFASVTGTVNIVSANPDAVTMGMRVTFAVASVLMVVALFITFISQFLSRLSIAKFNKD